MSIVQSGVVCSRMLREVQRKTSGFCDDRSKSTWLFVAIISSVSDVILDYFRYGIIAKELRRDQLCPWELGQQVGLQKAGLPKEWALRCYPSVTQTLDLVPVFLSTLPLTD